jgi:hypothetical protein
MENDMARKTNASRNAGSQPGKNAAEKQKPENQKPENRKSTARSSANGHGGAHRGASAGEPRRTGASRQSQRRESRSTTSSSSQPMVQRRASTSSGNVFFDTGSAVVDTIRQHPVPAALIGAGVAWLLLESRAARDAETRLLEQARGAAGRVGEAFSGLAETARSAYSEASHSTQQRLSGAAETLKDRAAALADYAGSGMSSVGSALQSGTRAVGDTAYTGYERSREALSEAWEQHPLAVGASLLVAGVATGLLLPASVREGRIMGDAAYNVAEKVKSSGSALIEQGKELVSNSTNALTREARRFGIGAAPRRSRKKR